MHPSSFFDLRARYIYTPLHGPYSLSEALEGLIFYSLDESRDSISIGSQRILRHELISELSNVVDDLQGYLIYFSSQFLISPLNSPDLVKELRASHNGFKYLSICWGAIITRIIIARRIVEQDFWPHLFHPTIDELAAFQRFKQTPSSLLPNASLDKPSISAPASISTFTSPSHLDTAPHSSYCPLELRRLPLNVQSECPQTTPSKANPTVRKEDHPSSLTLDIPPTPPGLQLIQIPSKHQPSDTSLESRLPQVFEDRPDKVFALPNHTSAAYCSPSLTSTHTSDARESGNSKGKERITGIDEKFAEKIAVAGEREQAIEVPCTPSPPIQLTAVQGSATRGLATMPTRTSMGSQPLSTESQPSSTGLQPSSTGLQPSSTTLRPSTVLQPSTTLQPSSTALWASPTASQLTSGAPYTLSSAPSFQTRRSTLFPRSTPDPRSFANANSWRPSSKEQRPQCSVPSAPIHSFSAIQKRLSKVQRRHFVPSPVHLTTPSPFQQRPSFDVHSRYPHSDITQPCQDERRTTEGPLLSIMVDCVGNTSLSMHDAHPIPPPVPSHDFYEHLSSHRLHPSTPFSPKKRRSSSPPFHRLENIRGQQLSRSQPCTPMVGKGCHTPSSACQPTPSRTPPSTLCQRSHPTSLHSRSTSFSSKRRCSSLPPSFRNRATSTESDGLSHNDKDTTTSSRESVSLHGDDPKGWRSSEFEDRVAWVIKRVTGGVTEGEATRELNTMPATISPSPMALPPTSVAPDISSSISTLHSTFAISLPHSLVRTSSRPPAHPSLKTQHSQLPIPSVQPSISSGLFHSCSTTRNRHSKTQTPHFRPSSAHSPSAPPSRCQSPANHSSPVCSSTTSPFISNSPSDLHSNRHPISLSHHIPLPRSFANVNSWHLNRLSSKEHRTLRSTPSATFHSLSATQRSSGVQRRPFASSPVGPPTPSHFQQHATYQFSDISLTSHVPRIIEDRLDDVFALPNNANAAHHSSKSTLTHISDAREPGNLTNKEWVVGNDDQRTEEIAVAVGGEETEATGKLITVSAKTSLPSTALQHASIIPAPAKTKSPSMTSQPMSTRRAPAQMSPSPITTDNTSDSSPPIAMNNTSSGHDIASISPLASSCSLDQHPASLHCPSTPSLPKRRCSSSPFFFHQLENTRKERAGMPLSQPALSTEHRDCTASDLLTPDSNMLSPPSKTCHSYPDIRNKQVQTKPLPLQGVLTVDNERCPLSTMPYSPSIANVNDLSFPSVRSSPYSGGQASLWSRSRAQSQTFEYDEHGYSLPGNNNTLNASHLSPKEPLSLAVNSPSDATQFAH